MYLEHLLCARHCSGHLSMSVNKMKSPALAGLPLWPKDTDVNHLNNLRNPRPLRTWGYGLSWGCCSSFQTVTSEL